ncbi:MAG: hypothetical protein KAY24_20095 [Candidatus Eisenbacteria sp.]|nr:hypothetical protein [Candidatus Eisenbacteria bacterium]
MTDVDGDKIYRCEICGVELEDDRDIIVLRAGQIRKSEKHGGFYFHPKIYNGKIVRLFCFHCMMTIGFDFADAEKQDGPDDCAFCPEDLVGEERCWELELGEFIGKIRRWRMHGQGGRAARLWCCWECMEHILGEGNIHTFRKRVGLPPLPDQRDWIEEKDVPEIMKRRPIRRVPRKTYAQGVS